MSRRRIVLAAACALLAVVLASVASVAAYAVRLFGGEHHGFRTLPPDRPVLVFSVERVGIRERFVFLNHPFPGKTVRLQMHLMRPEAYDRLDVSPQASAFRAYAVLEPKRAGEPTCCSRAFALVARRPPIERGRLVVPVDVSQWAPYPSDPSRPPTIESVWFADVSEFAVDDAEARALVARGLIGKPAIATVDATNPERLFVADLRGTSDASR